MERAVVASLVCGLVAFASPIDAQERPRTDALRFEVASVRPHRAADDVMFALQLHEGGRLTATGTLRMLIRTAYRLQEFQLEGARAWMDDERFDVDARARRDATADEMRLMLRSLLAERFGVALRAERRDGRVYALRPAQAGARGRVRPAAKECPGPCDIRFAPGVLNARGVTMTMLANELSWWVDRVVTDRTGLGARFDLDLEWSPDLVPLAPLASSSLDPPVARPALSNGPSIFTAVREQLGLSLEPERGEIDVLVIERAERPTAN